jgi:hypothetical protein
MVLGIWVPKDYSNIDWLFVGNDVRISNINITIRRNIDQRSVSKLSGIFFDLCGKVITVSRDNVEVSLVTKVLFGSFVNCNVLLGIAGLKVVVWICEEQRHFEN